MDRGTGTGKRNIDTYRGTETGTRREKQNSDIDRNRNYRKRPGTEGQG